ncbi:MAG: arylesterase [Gemmatimonadaceae bacterium]
MRTVLKKYALLLIVLGCGGGKPTNRDSAIAQGSVPEAGSTALAPSTKNPAPGPKYAPGSIIVFAGTSLTAGYGLDPDSAYPQIIQRKLDSAGLKFDVVNAGVSGETSSGLLRRLRWLLREPFEVFVIETGANDGLRGIPVETMASNIQQIIEGVRTARPRAQIMLIQMEAPPNLGTDYTRRFREVFPELAKRNGVILLPFLLENVAGLRHLNQGDGMHPNDEGERIVAENVWKALRPLLQ